MTTPTNLRELLAAMKASDESLGDWTSLPTFGGDEPSNTSRIWSWDEDYLIVGTAADDVKLISRADWFDPFGGPFGTADTPAELAVKETARIAAEYYDVRDAILESQDGRVEVEGGEGEDHDTGYAYIDPSEKVVMVAWRSGVSTRFFGGTGIRRVVAPR